MTENEQRRFEILLEQVLHQVRIVAEGYRALDAKIERFHKETREEHQRMMDLLKFSHDELNKKIDGVEQRLDAKIESVREELKEEIQAVGEKVAGHEARIISLEKKVA